MDFFPLKRRKNRLKISSEYKKERREKELISCLESCSSFVDSSLCNRQGSRGSAGLWLALRLCPPWFDENGESLRFFLLDVQLVWRRNHIMVSFIPFLQSFLFFAFTSSLLESFPPPFAWWSLVSPLSYISWWLPVLSQTDYLISFSWNFPILFRIISFTHIIPQEPVADSQTRLVTIEILSSSIIIFFFSVYIFSHVL